MNDEGHAAVELALAVGLLLLPAAIAVLSFGPWSERRVEAEAMAAEGSRAAVVELSHAAGESVVYELAGALGLDQSHLRLGWCGATPGFDGAGTCTMTRGSAVSLTVEVWVPLVQTPWGGVGGIWVSGSHSEPVDLYRSLG